MRRSGTPEICLGRKPECSLLYIGTQNPRELPTTRGSSLCLSPSLQMRQAKVSTPVSNTELFRCSRRSDGCQHSSLLFPHATFYGLMKLCRTQKGSSMGAICQNANPRMIFGGTRRRDFKHPRHRWRILFGYQISSANNANPPLSWLQENAQLYRTVMCAPCELACLPREGLGTFQQSHLLP